MRTELARLVFSAMVLVFGAAVEESLPKVLGVGFPVLLSSVLFMAVRGDRMPSIAFAIAAGAMEDALSALPPMTSVSFFLAAALLSRGLPFPRELAVLVNPVYQVWLALWVGSIGSGVFGRVLLSLPIGWATVFAVRAALGWVAGKAAVNEQG